MCVCVCSWVLFQQQSTYTIHAPKPHSVPFCLEALAPNGGIVSVSWEVGYEIWEAGWNSSKFQDLAPVYSHTRLMYVMMMWQMKEGKTTDNSSPMSQSHLISNFPHLPQSEWGYLPQAQPPWDIDGGQQTTTWTQTHGKRHILERRTNQVPLTGSLSIAN